MKISLLVFTSLLTILSKSVLGDSLNKADYYCTADDYQTVSTFRGKLFYFTLDSNCMKLKNTETKDTWSWKINLKNSLGDTEGSRNLCDKNDDGWVGNPAIWKSQDRKLISMDMHLGKTSFSCQPKE
jgi:hypothetical protein